MKRYCNSCVQTPELRETGLGEGKPSLICPVCKTEYYIDSEQLTKERPAKWPGKKAKSENWELVKGHWRSALDIMLFSNQK